MGADGAADGYGDGDEFVQRDSDRDDPQRVLAESRHQRHHPKQDHRELRWNEEGVISEKTSSRMTALKCGALSFF